MLVYVPCCSCSVDHITTGPVLVLCEVMEGGSICVFHPPEEGGEGGDWTAGVVGMVGDDGEGGGRRRLQYLLFIWYGVYLIVGSFVYLMDNSCECGKLRRRWTSPSTEDKL